ncbi:hypothetical protein [Frankia sp. AgW1.1]|uniref:hypothetical protein n=1 Tax=Frankia sp. AgW1.1 TaxID=1836971 RepID=UPI001932D5D8|nr:hypothetical protein [Frankia sp. AgW1.1]MBL7494381.1 hypothetical protein [Frankia sp. AgW1.1]
MTPIGGDFYEDDEPIEDIRAAWARAFAEGRVRLTTRPDVEVSDEAVDTAWRETSSCHWYGSTGGVNQPVDAVRYILNRAAPEIVAPFRAKLAALAELADLLDAEASQWRQSGYLHERGEASGRSVAAHRIRQILKGEDDDV